MNIYTLPVNVLDKALKHIKYKLDNVHKFSDFASARHFRNLRNGFQND